MISQLVVHIPSTAADTTDEWYVPQAAPGTWRLIAAYFAPATAVTANDTNYVQVDLSTGTGASSTYTACATAMTTQVTGGAAMVIGTVRSFTLSGAQLDLPQGYNIKIAKTDPGSGQILDGCFTFALQKVN